MSEKRKALLVFLVALVCVSFVSPALVGAVARAQGVTLVSITPADSSLAAGSTVEVQVKVTDVVELNAFDLTILYDAEVIKLNSWSHGGFLTNPTVVYKEEVPGRLQLVVTQLAAAGASGDGVLLNLVFYGDNPGISSVDLQNVELANSNSQLISSTQESGTITVTEEPLPSDTATLTLTPTPTLTPTSTFTFTPTPTATTINTSLPVITWTPTRTRTPTLEYFTRTPLRAIVVTRTGTPGTAVVVQPGAPVETSAPSALETKPATGEIGVVAGAGADPTLESRTDTPAGLREVTATAVGVDLVNTTPGSSANSSTGSTSDAIDDLKKANTFMWGIGVMILGILTALVVLFIKTWKKL